MRARLGLRRVIDHRTAEEARAAPTNLARRATSEAIATALLLAAIVGSGIMGQRLAAGNVAIALLANAIATGAGLIALIVAFGPISGAHLNPVVSAAEAARGNISTHDAATYAAAQILGAFVGVALAHGMFEEPLFSISQHARSGFAQFLSEIVATFGLLAVIQGGKRTPASVPFAVGGYITAAYWFTGSTSFANPAVTLARAASDTFAGIRPTDVAMFLAAQAIGATGATALFHWLDVSSTGVNFRAR